MKDLSLSIGTLEALDKPLADKETTKIRLALSRDEMHLIIENIKNTLEADVDVFLWEYEEEQIFTSKKVMHFIIESFGEIESLTIEKGKN